MSNYEEKLKQLVKSAKCVDAKKVAGIETLDEEVTLVLINKEQLDELLSLENSIAMDFTERGSKSKNTFFTFGKIINPSDAAYKYNIKSKHSYKTIKDPSSILAKVKEHHDIWVNKKNKFRDEKLMDVWENPDDKERFKKEFDLEMTNAENIYNALLEDFSSYDVVISNYESYHYYPFLTYTLKNGKSCNTMLRQGVPNFLYYEPDMKRSKKRSDNNMNVIIEDYERLCENIYFTKK